MSYFTIIRENGPGLGILAIYTFALTYFVALPRLAIAQNTTVIASVAALSVVALLLLLSVNFNNEIMEFLAEESIADAYIQIKINQGANKEFYTGYDRETRAAIDELDERSHQAVISILSALLIAISLPIVGYFVAGLRGTGIGMLVATLPIALLGYPSYTALHETLRFAVRESKPNHEN